MLIGGYMWQARTTKDGFGPCFHAHFDAHPRKVGPRYDQCGELSHIVKPSDPRGGGVDFPFIRHYHSPTPLGYCVERDSQGQNWKYYAGWLDFEIRDYRPSDRWPETLGSYIFVKHTDDQLFPIYVGQTDNQLFPIYVGQTDNQLFPIYVGQTDNQLFPIYVGQTDNQLFPIYVGQTDNLKDSLSIPRDSRVCRVIWLIEYRLSVDIGQAQRMTCFMYGVLIGIVRVTTSRELC